ncbi:MAG: hypothetical protein IIB57_09340 [Planctomycetes bacterium]|nr:hypothetical protein [Planctomycetota bacterium]
MISHKVVTCLSALLLIVATEKNQADTPEQNNIRQREPAAADARREMEIRERGRAQTPTELEARAAKVLHIIESKKDGLYREFIEQQKREVELEAAAETMHREGKHDEALRIERDLANVRAEVVRCAGEFLKLQAVVDRYDARRDMETRERERAQTRADAETLVADERRNLEREMYELERELIEQRMRVVDLEAAAETLELEGKHEEYSAIRRDLVQVRAELERRELQLELRRSDVNRHAERYEMLRMRDRLQYVSDWRSVAFDPQEAVMMATQAVVESAFVGGGLERAVELLEGLLGEIHDVGSRTAIRFALRDLYGESGQPDVATEHLKQIILENARGLDGDHDGDRQ